MRSNKELIREYSFWEIRAGDIAKLWEESWQQQEKLLHKEALQVIQAFTFLSEGDMVEKFWKPCIGEYWHNQKQKEDWVTTPNTERWGNYNKEMTSRKVAVKIGQDILRWGT